MGQRYIYYKLQRAFIVDLMRGYSGVSAVLQWFMGGNVCLLCGFETVLF